MYVGPSSTNNEHVPYENGLAARKGATCLHAVVRIGTDSTPPAAVRYMDQKDVQYVGGKEKGILGGRTPSKVEEGCGD